ncbi:hypothetical protein Tco_1049334 [Tanacetum coccineum]
MGPLSGKGPRVIVFADASVLPWPVFVRGDARVRLRRYSRASLKYPEHGPCILLCVSLIMGQVNIYSKCRSFKEHLVAICAKYFIPEESHPQLPSSDATMHERPTGKVGMYTRFFDYANYPYANEPGWMDLNAFIRTADPRKVRIVERPRAENERPIVTVAKHRTVTLLPTSVVRSSGELSASVEREFVRDASVGDGGDQGFDSVAGQDNVEPTVPVTEPVEAEIPRPKRSKKKRVIYDSEGLPVASHPPKRLRADYGTTGGSATGGKSPSVLNRLLQDSRLTVEQGVPALPTLPFITSSVTAYLWWRGGGDRADSVDWPSPSTNYMSLRKVCCSGYDLRGFHCCSTVATHGQFLLFVSKDRGGQVVVPCGRGCSAGRRSIYVPECRTVRGMEHEQLFTEFNVSAARNLSLSSEVRMRAEYNILEKRKWRSLAEEKNILLEAKDKEIEDLKSQLLKAKEESAEVTQLRAQVSGLEATENSLRGEVASAKDHNVLLEQEYHELSDLGASSSSLKSQNQSLVNQVHELEISSADLREKLEMYEGLLKQLEEFQDNLMGPLRTRLAEIDADFTRCCMRFQESFHPHLLNVVAGRRWLLTHGMKLLVVKCLNSNEYMEALGHAFGRAIEKGMQEGLAAGIEHGQAGRCLTDLEAYIPSAEDDFNSAIRDLRDLNFPLLQELSNNKDASTWDIMDLLRLDDAVAETLGMTDLQPVEKMERNLIERLPFLKDVQPDVSQLMVHVHHKQDRVVIGSQVLSATFDIFRRTDPSVSVEDYDNPDSADVVPENATLGSESEGKIDASAGGGLTLSQLDDEARDAVL